MLRPGKSCETLPLGRCKKSGLPVPTVHCSAFSASKGLPCPLSSSNFVFQRGRWHLDRSGREREKRQQEFSHA